MGVGFLMGYKLLLRCYKQIITFKYLKVKCFNLTWQINLDLRFAGHLLRIWIRTKYQSWWATPWLLRMPILAGLGYAVPNYNDLVYYLIL